MIQARPRTAPARPIARISRATVQRATRNAFAPQLLPDLARAVHLVVLVVDALDLGAQRVVALRPRRPPRRIDLPCAMPWYVDGAIGSTAQIGSTPY